MDATDHIFTDNQTESGYYRNGGCLQPTERARFRIDNTNGGALSITQVSGVKCNASVSRSAATCILTSVGNAGAQYQFEMLPHCNATTAAATNMTHMCAYTYTLSGSNRTITALTYAPAAGAGSLAAFSFAAAGNTGTFFMDVTF